MPEPILCSCSDDMPLLNHPFQLKRLHRHDPWRIKDAIFRQPTKSLARGFGFSAAGSNRDITEGPTGGPIPLAALTEMAWLINIVIIEVTKFGVHAFASRTGDDLVRPFFCRLLIWIVGLFFKYPVVMQHNSGPKQLNSSLLIFIVLLSLCHHHRKKNTQNRIVDFGIQLFFEEGIGNMGIYIHKVKTQKCFLRKAKKKKKKKNGNWKLKEQKPPIREVGGMEKKSWRWAFCTHHYFTTSLLSSISFFYIIIKKKKYTFIDFFYFFNFIVSSS